MADKGPEDKENSESLSATAMFLRSFATDAQPASKPAEPASPVAAAEPQKTEAGEFTRMFRPMVPAEPAQAPLTSAIAPPSLPSTPAPGVEQAGNGDFTRAFSVPRSSTAAEPLPVAPPNASTTPSKGKGFSTPGVSGSASAEGSFTRVFKASPPQQPAPSEALPPFSFETPTAPPPPETPRTGPVGHASGVTELFRALSPDHEKLVTESAYRPDPAPTPHPYTEPTELKAPDRPAGALPPGGGVTALLNRLTAETPLPPSDPVPLPVQRPPIQHAAAPAAPGDTRGEFTRIIQAAEVQAALAAEKPPAVAPASAMPVPAPPAFPAPAPPPPAPHLAPVLPALPALPKVAAPAVPKLKVEAPAVAPPPKTKLKEMVPLLLVANAFLMLILILLVAFALFRK